MKIIVSKIDQRVGDCYQVSISGDSVQFAFLVKGNANAVSFSKELKVAQMTLEGLLQNERENMFLRAEAIAEMSQRLDPEGYAGENS